MLNQDKKESEKAIEVKSLAPTPTFLSMRGYGLVFDSFIAYQTFFTCKTFRIQEDLHVKIQNTLKGAKHGNEIKVA